MQEHGISMVAWQRIGVLAICSFMLSGLTFCSGCSGCSGCNEQIATYPAACMVDSDCPEGTPDEWSECENHEDACALHGTQHRTVDAFACQDGKCERRERVETRSCRRATDGIACDDDDACTMDDRCAGGVCQGQARRCDDGNPCTADACDAELGCVHEAVRACRARRAACKDAGAACDTGNPCERGEIRCVEGKSQCVVVGVASADTVCRPARGPCDLAEFCTGTGAECPADRLASADSVCRAAAGPCDVAEACTGAGPECPADALLAGGTGCTLAASGCDLDEDCTATSSSFLADSGSCDANAYYLLDTCWDLPRVEVQGRHGARCSDLGHARDEPLLRLVFRGRPAARFRYKMRHASCVGSFSVEYGDVRCDEGPVNRFDANGTCTLTIRNDTRGARCPDGKTGRWEVHIESDGHRSDRAYIHFYDSSTSCTDHPRTCDAALVFCPATGPCNDVTCAGLFRGQAAPTDVPALFDEPGI